MNILIGILLLVVVLIILGSVFIDIYKGLKNNNQYGKNL